VQKLPKEYGGKGDDWKLGYPIEFPVRTKVEALTNEFRIYLEKGIENIFFKDLLYVMGNVVIPLR